ncbi:MAG TPA: IucA/IucC family C-terminal-domain containing protein [Metabacillus sp.]|nr:IucA/IucC family C-terminal-domain containing protein [Metabacillus sp.]
MAELTKEEQETLEKYRLCLKGKSPHLMIEGPELLKVDRLKRLFNEDLQKKLNTDKHQVLGSMLVKRYAFLAALVLYSMSVFNKGINSSIENLSLYTEEDDPIWLPSFHFKNLEVTTSTSNRNEWREEVLEALFKQNIALMVATISRVTRISKVILWENVAIYIFWMYESTLEDPNIAEESKTRIEEDFSYIVLEAAPTLFGVKAKNPLAPFFHEKHNNVRKRSTCCLFYLTSKNDDRCNTCPIECKRQN